MATQSSGDDALFAALEAYPWASDADFQSGLHAILGTSSSSASSPAAAVTQGGGGGGGDAQTRDLALHARCFYYARKHALAAPVDFQGYSAWRAAQPVEALSDLMASPAALAPPPPLALDDSSAESTPQKRAAAPGQHDNPNVPQEHAQTQASTPGTEGQVEGKPLSFQEIMDMIQSQKPIPGIKDIPDTVLVGQGTEPARDRRQKPWERSDAQQPTSTSFFSSHG